MQRLKTLTKCNCCDNKIEVYTIYGLIKNAYKTIEKNEFIKKILAYNNLTKETVAISQNRSRKVADQFNEETHNKYEVIKSGKDDAIFCVLFNESLTSIEGISINKNYYQYRLDKSYFTLEDVAKDLKRMFELLNIDILERFNILVVDDYIKIEQINHEKYIKIHNITILDKDYSYIDIMFDSDSVNKNNLAFYLHQNIVSMYPDFGMADFWIGSTSTSIEEFGDLIDSKSDLAVRVEEWIGWFNCHAPQPCCTKEWLENPFDWDKFDKVGRALHKELQEIVQDKFIVTYFMSFEESISRRYKRDYNSFSVL